jgi:hypothetical protein
MSSTAVPVYFELSWSILSSIGLLNTLFGVLVVGITSLSPISIVPIIVSTACAIANGMCYYAFYADYPQIPTVVAGAFADFMWLVSSYDASPKQKSGGRSLTVVSDTRSWNVLLQLPDPDSGVGESRSDSLPLPLLVHDACHHSLQSRNLGQPSNAQFERQHRLRGSHRPPTCGLLHLHCCGGDYQCVLSPASLCCSKGIISWGIFKEFFVPPFNEEY